MKRKWSLKRQFIEQDDGQRRWDNAYQLLLPIAVVPKDDTVSIQAEVVSDVKSSGVSL
jgi:hypothetical protein